MGTRPSPSASSAGYIDDVNETQMRALLHATEPIYAARVGLGHRALAMVEAEVVVWCWSGTHAE